MAHGLQGARLRVPPSLAYCSLFDDEVFYSLVLEGTGPGTSGMCVCTLSVSRCLSVSLHLYLFCASLS